MEKEYAGKVWAVYRDEGKHGHFGVYGIMVCLFDSSRGAEKYVTTRKRTDELRGEEFRYSVVPWLVQRG
jgi:hypothetical protein